MFLSHHVSIGFQCFLSSFQVIAHFQAKDLKPVYFSQLCKSTFKRMITMQPQCMSQTLAAAGKSAPLKDYLGSPAAVKPRCSTQLLSIHRPFLTKQACTSWAVTFSSF